MDGGNPLREEVLGTSGAAAVVVSALYFIGAILTIANWVYTKFTFYDVLLISCVCAFVAPAPPPCPAQCKLRSHCLSCVDVLALGQCNVCAAAHYCCVSFGHDDRPT